MSAAYIAACLALFLPLFAGGVVFWVDVLERAITRWHEDHVMDRCRRLHPTRSAR